MKNHEITKAIMKAEQYRYSNQWDKAIEALAGIENPETPGWISVCADYFRHFLNDAFYFNGSIERIEEILENCDGTISQEDAERIRELAIDGLLSASGALKMRPDFLLEIQFMRRWAKGDFRHEGLYVET